jgi:GDP-4-dehydro-6-deoxy-D-mannose reductase
MGVAVVTGAGGFVGRHLCARLHAEGERVIALARGQSQPVSAGVRRAACSSLDIASLSSVLAREQPEVIYHMAGSTDADVSVLYEANVCYVARLLHAAAVAVPSATLVLVGSAAEYGPPLHPEGIVNERDPCRPRSAYGISKLAQTHHGLAAASRGQHVVVARLFNPIGPGSPATNAVGAFVRQIAAAPAQGGTLTTGPLHAVRDFTDIEDVTRALVGLARHPLARGLIVNVCSGRGLTLASVVERLLALSPVPIRHDFDTSRRGTSDLDVVVGDPSQLGRLGLALPTLDLDAVLRRILAQLNPGQGGCATTIRPT